MYERDDVKKKSLGFVRLGFDVGSTHAKEERSAITGKHGGLGLELGRRAADSFGPEDCGDQRRQQRKPFSKLLLDRDNPKDQEDHETPPKRT